MRVLVTMALLGIGSLANVAAAPVPDRAGMILLASSPLPVAGQERVTVTVNAGRVSLKAQQASAQTILAEWARAAGVAIVNIERIGGGPLLNLELADVPERRMIDTLLGDAVGYILTLRPADASGAASAFERLYIAPAPGAETDPAAFPAPTSPVVFEIVPAAPGASDGRPSLVSVRAPAAEAGTGQREPAGRRLLGIGGSGEMVEAPATAPAPPPASGQAPGTRTGFGALADPAFAGPGVRIASVARGSPAEKAGLARGDVLLTLDGRGVAGPQAFADMLETLAPGQTIAVVYAREGQKRTASITVVGR